MIDFDNLDPDSPEAQEFMDKFKLRFKGYPPNSKTVEVRQIVLGLHDCILIEPTITDDEIGFTITVSGLEVTEANMRETVKEQLGILADLIRDDHDRLQLEEQ